MAKLSNRVIDSFRFISIANIRVSIEIQPN